MFCTTFRGSKNQFKITELASTEVLTLKVLLYLLQDRSFYKKISEFEETHEETPSPGAPSDPGSEPGIYQAFKRSRKAGNVLDKMGTPFHLGHQNPL